ncbi:MAG: cytidylate kinase-like family protein [Bacteroidaceae bacterium]|nr:cytidylate kinase-like family protein [Bacteroidaceae bacterium]MBR1379849.1 cytidylate kinase-like family protein [Bacteroidaceae bacterium]
MENYVITIGRELGSGGKHIGELMAQQLNVPIYDNRLITIAAQESGINPALFEKADEVTNKVTASTVMRAITSPFQSVGNFYDISLSNEALFKVQTDVINKKAETESCIIVGRCADYILRNHPRHLNIFVRANYDDRVKFICNRDNLTPAKARHLIDKTDNQRSEYHDFYCETNWGDSRAYDICVNSSLLGLEGTAQFLLDFAKSYLKI